MALSHITHISTYDFRNELYQPDGKVLDEAQRATDHIPALVLFLYELDVLPDDLLVVFLLDAVGLVGPGEGVIAAETCVDGCLWFMRKGTLRLKLCCLRVRVAAVKSYSLVAYMYLRTCSYWSAVSDYYMIIV
jgi:hypothetical protein